MKALDLNPLFPGAKAKPDPIKGGLCVTSFFTYNCLAVSLCETVKQSRKVFSQSYSKMEMFQLLVVERKNNQLVVILKLIYNLGIKQFRFPCYVRLIYNKLITSPNKNSNVILVFPLFDL